MPPLLIPSREAACVSRTSLCSSHLVRHRDCRRFPLERAARALKRLLGVSLASSLAVLGSSIGEHTPAGCVWLGQAPWPTGGAIAPTAVFWLTSEGRRVLGWGLLALTRKPFLGVRDALLSLQPLCGGWGALHGLRKWLTAPQLDANIVSDVSALILCH